MERCVKIAAIISKVMKAIRLCVSKYLQIYIHGGLTETNKKVAVARNCKTVGLNMFCLEIADLIAQSIVAINVGEIDVSKVEIQSFTEQVGVTSGT